MTQHSQTWPVWAGRGFGCRHHIERAACPSFSIFDPDTDIYPGPRMSPPEHYRSSSGHWPCWLVRGWLSVTGDIHQSVRISLILSPIYQLTWSRSLLSRVFRTAPVCIKVGLIKQPSPLLPSYLVPLLSPLCVCKPRTRYGAGWALVLGARVRVTVSNCVPGNTLMLFFHELLTIPTCHIIIPWLGLWLATRIPSWPLIGQERGPGPDDMKSHTLRHDRLSPRHPHIRDKELWFFVTTFTNRNLISFGPFIKFSRGGRWCEQMHHQEAAREVKTAQYSWRSHSF